MPLGKILKFWFPVLVYSGMIFYASSLSVRNVGSNISCGDKIFHVAEYFPFGFLLARALLSANNKTSLKILFFWVAMGSFVYGVSDEFHQSFVSNRDATFWDALADLFGGALGGYCYIAIIKSMRMNYKKH